MKHLRLWLARNEGKEEEYIHDRYTHIPGELLVCFDKPILKYDPDEHRNKWMYCNRLLKIKKNNIKII